jgi:hypothetical protein
MIRAAMLSLLILSQTAVLVAIWRRGMVRPYFFFSLYVLCLAARQVRLCFLDPFEPEYLRFWALTLVLVMPLQILAAGECLYRSLERFREIRVSLFGGAFAIAAVVATAIYDLQTRQTHLGRFSLADQAVVTTLFLAGAVTAVGLTWINPQRKRSAILHERLLLYHFGVLAGSLFLLHQGYSWIRPLGAPSAAAGFFAWAWLVRNDSELESSKHDLRGPGVVPTAGAGGSPGWASIR